MNSMKNAPAQEPVRGSLEQELHDPSDWVLSNYPHDVGLGLLSICLPCLADKARRLEASAAIPPDRTLPRTLQAGVGKGGAPYIQYFDPDC